MGEAIDSMYRWYSLAKVCIAYLQDVSFLGQIKESGWFNRGWTLQELIAPKTVYFFDRNWNRLGDKTSLSNIIVTRTGIPADVLKNNTPPQACSVAQRMSWAAKRTTKRLEDRAYCLMGLFNVNMPMIYGERERAFIRLQEQIISKSTDESIFAWDLDLLDDSTRDAKEVYCGLLATSPACFARCGNVISTGHSLGFHINQFGLSILLPAALYTLGTYQAHLNVARVKTAGHCAIFLTKLPGENSFVRTSTPSGESISMTEAFTAAELMEFSVALEPTEAPLRVYPGFWLRKLGFNNSHITGYKVVDRRYTTDSDRLMLPDGEIGTAGIIRLSLRDGDHYGFGWIKLGFDSVCRPICFMTFPDFDNEDPSTVTLPSEAEDVLALERGSAKRLNHPIFNNDWTQASSRTISCLPSYEYDSRMGTGDLEEGFDFTFKAPLFDITVSASRIPDIRPTSNRKGEVWAVELVAGTAPVYYHDDGCCC